MSSGEVVSILVAHHNSHPFTSRECIVTNKDNKLKLGRAVAKLKQASDNFIFECKVLSRNHALIWREGDKFYLQDTKSSNGTYVNNERLSACNEESDPREIFSGDILQFGVDVTDNQKKVTHGCIIATLRLVRDGMELERPVSTIDRGSTSRPGDAISSKDCKELLKILSHAMHREQEVEVKLNNIDRVIGQAQGIVEDNMKTRIQEDRLISRIEAMEQQIKMYAQDYSQTDLKTQLAESYKSKYDLENYTKERLRDYHKQLVEGSEKLQDTTRELNKAQDEYSNVRTAYDKFLVEYEIMRNSNRKQQIEIKEHQERIEHLESDKELFNLRYQEDCQDLRLELRKVEEERESVIQERDTAVEKNIDLDVELKKKEEVISLQSEDLEERSNELDARDRDLGIISKSCTDQMEQIEFLLINYSGNISQLAIANALIQICRENELVSELEAVSVSPQTADNILVGEADAVSVLRERLENVQSQLVTTEHNYNGLVQDLQVANLVRTRRERRYQQQQIGLLALAICLLVVIIAYLFGAML